MRELNEQELELVAGGNSYSVVSAGSSANLKKGTYGSFSNASLVLTSRLIVAGADNATLATGSFTDGVNSGASITGVITH
jgi:hypothetical protein